MNAANLPPLVSVVTPFHNTGQYLRECIESVLAQTHANFEYILHDNASTDGATDIALEYARRDSRIRYFRLDDLVPQIPNYNLAMSRIDPTSRYCKVAQADDWLMSDCLRQMVELGERAPNVGLISAYRLDGDVLAGEGLHYSVNVLPGRETARRHLLQKTFLFGSPTTVMYRSDVVRERQPDFYPANRLNEDTEACFEILEKWDFGFVHQVLSYTRVEDTSITGRMANKDAHALARLLRMQRFGRRFLDENDFGAGLAGAERRYYRQLARAQLSLRNSEYWSFQNKGLASAGLSLSRAKLLRGMAAELLDLLGHPKLVIEYIRNWRT